MAALLREMREEAAVPVRPAAVPRPVTAELRADGYGWTIVFDGVEASVPDAKGMVYLAHLLAAPGEHVSAVDLAGVPVRWRSGERLDTRARAAVRERARDLEGELAAGRTSERPRARRAPSRRARRAHGRAGAQPRARRPIASPRLGGGAGAGQRHATDRGGPREDRGGPSGGGPLPRDHRADRHGLRVPARSALPGGLEGSSSALIEPHGAMSRGLVLPGQEASGFLVDEAH